MLEFGEQLEQLEQRDLRRTRRTVTSAQGRWLDCDGRRYLAFCSNDYLGLANHPHIVQAAHHALDRYGVGAAASALICGHMLSHQQLEQKLAQFVGLPRALYFSCGYTSALGVIPALVGRGDAVFSDALNHASLIDGTRLSRAQVYVYPHADLAALAQQLGACDARRKLVVSDAVFSMDGDLAPVPELLSLCREHDATLMLDDAHGFGVLGEGGRGSLSHWRINAPRLIYMATLGKAAGVSGAFVAASAEVIDWLVQRARSYVFSTSPPPVLAAAADAAIDLIEREQWRRQRLAQLIARLRELTLDLPLRLLPSATAIQPLIVGENHAALTLAAKLRAADVWVPAIRPPTVPEGTARLRISLSAAHELQDVEQLAAALRAGLA